MKPQDLVCELRHFTASLPDDAKLPNRRDLCARFKVTTFVLQQALQTLEHEGSIVVIARKGAFVKRNMAVEAHYLQMIYMDHPQQRLHEQGIEAFLCQCKQWNIGFRAIHAHSGQTEQLQQFLNQYRDDPHCFGLVVGGYVTETDATLLANTRQPWVLFGDVVSPQSWTELPSVVGDHFQGGLLAANHLHTQGCTHLVLVDFLDKQNCSWVRETYAGILAGIEHHRHIQVLLPQHKNADAMGTAQLETQVLNSLNTTPDSRVGILCRQAYNLIPCVRLEQALARINRQSTIVCVGEESPLQNIEGISHVHCAVNQLVHVCLTRLAAMRRAADTPGRRLIPYTFLPHPV